MTMSKEMEVQVLGKNFSFNLPNDIKPDDFLRIVDYVETKMDKIKGAVSEIDSFKLGLLTSLNITEELFAAHKEIENLNNMLGKIDKIVTPSEGETVSGKKDKDPLRFSS